MCDPRETHNDSAHRDRWRRQGRWFAGVVDDATRGRFPVRCGRAVPGAALGLLARGPMSATADVRGDGADVAALAETRRRRREPGRGAAVALGLLSTLAGVREAPRDAARRGSELSEVRAVLVGAFSHPVYKLLEWRVGGIASEALRAEAVRRTLVWVTDMFARDFERGGGLVVTCRREGTGELIGAAFVHAYERPALVVRRKWPLLARLWAWFGRVRGALETAALFWRNGLHPSFSPYGRWRYGGEFARRFASTAPVVEGVRREVTADPDHIRTPRFLYVRMLGVRPDARDAGAGSAMLDAIAATADALRLDAFLETDEDQLRGFYERRAGFRVAKEYGLRSSSGSEFPGRQYAMVRAWRDT